ncbi:Ig-like domain repeat protein [Methanobrevibacter smithii]|uniref:Ig-like domain repeat protein n=1 Tax=Methanobrevibacter smithii TaxID=2173 RepID=UPI00373AF384
MVVAAENIKYGNDAVITATLTPTTATGNVTFTINGKTENANIVDGVASATFKDLTPGDYIVNVNYDGDDACDGSTNSTSFNVAKADSDVVISVDDVVYGGDVTVVAAVSSGATGNVTFTVNGVNKSAAVVDGKANATFSNLGAGDYSVVASYEGDNNYKASNSTAKFNVAKADANLDVSIADVDYQNIFTIEAVLTGINGAKLTGDVMVSINNILLFTVKVVDGNGTFAGDTLIVGSYNFTARWAGNDNYNNIKSEGVFKVNKIDSNITVNADDIKVGENATVTVNVSSDATGDVIITVDGKNYTVAIVDGKAVKTIADLKANNYTVTVKYAGDNNYNPNQNTTKFTVSKISDYNMNITVPGDVKVGEDAVIIVNVPKDASGNVTVSVGKDVYNAVISNGSVKVVVSGLDAGNYSVVASYDGDNNYKASNSTAKFNVAKADVDVKINVGDIKVGETAIITVIVSPGVTGNVTVIVNGKSETVNVTDGNATLKVANLAANKYDVTVIYNGNDNYNVAKANASFVVSKVSDYKMNVTVPTITAGENAVIEVSLPKDATNNVTVVINNKKYTAAVLNGSAKVIIPGLTAGKYNMSVSYSGDDKYTQSSANFNITVEANKNVNLNISDIVMIYKDGTRMVAVLTDYLGNPIANATVYFTINGQTYNKTTDANGTASMGLNLVSNVYNATVSYNGSDMYNKISKNITVTINPTIVADDLVKMYQNATRFYAKFTDSTGKALANTIVRFNIHGVFYNKTTDKDGVADLGIMLRPGNYILTAYNPVTGEEKGFNITVKSLIVQSDLTKYYLNASRFEATVYNKDGSLAVNKNVTFNINGVFYTKTTDKNGVASLGISLRPGNYTITTMYDGLDIGNKVNVMPTLVTKDLSMKHLDGSNFTALTLDGQGKPLANQNVSFNVNGVFYHKVTNKEGIASLGIRLMSGEYIITSYWNDFQTGNTIKISP